MNVYGIKENEELMRDFWRRVRGWNGFPQHCFIGVHQIGEWQVVFRTPDGLLGIYDGLRHITRQVFDDFDKMEEFWFNREISCNIEHQMILAGYTEETLAEAIGVSAKTVYNYLNGKTAPRTDTLFKIAKVLGCTPDDLFYVESRYK